MCSLIPRLLCCMGMRSVAYWSAFFTAWFLQAVVFRPYRKVEKGSGVLRDISCYREWGLCTKNIILAFFLIFEETTFQCCMLYSSQQLKKMAAKFLKTAENKFIHLPISFKNWSLTLWMFCNLRKLNSQIVEWPLLMWQEKSLRTLDYHLQRTCTETHFQVTWEWDILVVLRWPCWPCWPPFIDLWLVSYWYFVGSCGPQWFHETSL